MPRRTFSKKLRAFPISTLAMYQQDLPVIYGGKVLMPPDTFLQVYAAQGGFTRHHTTLILTSSKKVVHAGVLEFNSPDPEAVYVPDWHLDNLELQPGQEVRVRVVTLRNAASLKVQFGPEAAMSEEEARDALENHLKTYAALTVGDRIKVVFQGKDYPVEVTETKVQGKKSSVKAARLPPIGSELGVEVQFQKKKEEEGVEQKEEKKEEEEKEEEEKEEEEKEEEEKEEEEKGEDETFPGPGRMLMAADEDGQPQQKKAKVEEEEKQKIRDARLAKFAFK